MKRLIALALVLVALGAFTVTPAFAMEACDHEMTHDLTVAGLVMHVEHAYDHGHINTVGTKTNLLALLNRAAAAADQGMVDQEVRALQAFTLAVKAQAGTQIDATCAEHLAMHAEHVIMTLQGGM